MRLLIVYKSNSSSLSHPLLFDLAEVRKYRLSVFIGNPAYKKKLDSLFQDSIVFFTTSDPFNLTKDEMYNTEIELKDAMETLSVELAGRAYTIKEIILNVANTEASHSDPSMPSILADLEQIQIGGLPTHYRVIYSSGRVVRDLCYQSLRASI